MKTTPELRAQYRKAWGDGKSTAPWSYGEEFRLDLLDDIEELEARNAKLELDIKDMERCALLPAAKLADVVANNSKLKARCAKLERVAEAASKLNPPSNSDGLELVAALAALDEP